jgi:hypothetical protein
MPSIFIGTPIQRGQLEPETLLSLMALRRRLLIQKIPHHIATNETCYISYSRNGLVDAFLKMPHDHFLWIDSDMLFPDYGVTRLLNADKDIIGGVYYKKMFPYDPLAFQLGEDGNFRTWFDYPKDKMFKCGAVATGFMLVKRKVMEAFTPEVIKELSKPFDLGRNPNSGNEEGEDLAFCRRAQKLGFEVWCDPTIPLGHIGKKVYDKDLRDEAELYNLYRRQHSFKTDIDGWMNEVELGWLYEQAQTMESVVEVGSWKGRSTKALLEGCKGTVYAIDHWQGSEGELDSTHKEVKDKDIYAEFMKNVGEYPNLKVMKMPSVEAAKQFENKSVDMVFLDGGHRYSEVKADIEAWLPKAKKLICGHDYNGTSVQEAVTEKFSIPDTADGIWIKELKSG